MKYRPSPRCECSRAKELDAEACPRCLRIDSANHHAKRPTGIRRREKFLNVNEAHRAFANWLVKNGLEKI